LLLAAAESWPTGATTFLPAVPVTFRLLDLTLSPTPFISDDDDRAIIGTATSSYPVDFPSIESDSESHPFPPKRARKRGLDQESASDEKADSNPKSAPKANPSASVSTLPPPKLSAPCPQLAPPPHSSKQEVPSHPRRLHAF
jgi:hypothetical protein